MQRQLLRVVLVLGVLVTLVGGTGLYAVFSDQASTGTNQVDSGAVARAADLQIATGHLSPGPVDCGTFVEDLTVGVITMTDAQPGSVTNGTFCLKNAGTASLGVTMTASNIVNIELDCSGDEASVDDTCDAGRAGELSPNLVVVVTEALCASSDPTNSSSSALDDLVGAPIILRGGTAIGPGATYCGYWTVIYPDSTKPDLVQLAQTDRATWAFTFVGTAQ